MQSQKEERLVPVEAEPVRVVAEALFGGQLIGVYLYGSAMLGGLQKSSDVDLLIILKEPLSEPKRRELTDQLLRLSGRPGDRDAGRPLEVTVICRAEVAPWRFPPKCEYLYGEWLREQIEAGEIPKAGYDPDVAVLLWQARRYSLPLTGPAAETVIDPIPMRDIREATRRSLPGLMANLKGDERNVLLTLARMWVTAETGALYAKDAAAAWVCPRLPQQYAALLETARAAYLGEKKDCWSGLETETEALADFLRRSVETLLAG